MQVAEVLPNSPADPGLREGDMITRVVSPVGTLDTSSYADLVTHLAPLNVGERIILTVRRSDPSTRQSQQLRVPIRVGDANQDFQARTTDLAIWSSEQTIYLSLVNRSIAARDVNVRVLVPEGLRLSYAAIGPWATDSFTGARKIQIYDQVALPVEDLTSTTGHTIPLVRVGDQDTCDAIVLSLTGPQAPADRGVGPATQPEVKFIVTMRGRTLERSAIISYVAAQFVDIPAPSDGPPDDQHTEP